MPGDWRRDYNEAQRCLPAIRTIVKALAGEIITITLEVAEDEADRKRATDYEIRATAGGIACRIRWRDNCPYRDWTVRYSRRSGAETEWAKLVAGHARWYLYGWADRRSTRIPEWMWVDLDAARAAGIFSHPRWSLRPNRDGGSDFKALSWGILRDAGLLTAWNMQGSLRRPNAA